MRTEAGGLSDTKLSLNTNLFSFVMEDYYGEDIFTHLDDPAFDEARKTHE